MKDKNKKASKRNPVAKNAKKFNSTKVFEDKTKYNRKKKINPLLKK